MRTIELELTQSGWTANFIDDESVLSLFGTTVLPTPYTKNTCYADVRASIQQFNPGYEVI